MLEPYNQYSEETEYVLGLYTSPKLLKKSIGYTFIASSNIWDMRDSASLKFIIEEIHSTFIMKDRMDIGL